MARPSSIDLHGFETPEAVAEEAAARIMQAATDSVAQRGRFVLALSGGETPKLTYQRLAQPDLRDKVPWRETLIVWTDERCLPPEHQASNYRMASEALLDHIPLPADNVLRIRGEECMISEDQRYEQALHRLLDFGGHEAPIDLMLLGVGTDGHTASLFPNSVALVERERWVLPSVGPQPYPQRITLTLPIINATRSVLILATGERKAPIIQAMREGKADPKWPITLVKPHRGGPTWLVDRAACP
jgi:6-phosphogluconolactonase